VGGSALASASWDKPKLRVSSFSHYFSGCFEGLFHANNPKALITAYFVKKRMPNQAKK